MRATYAAITHDDDAWETEARDCQGVAALDVRRRAGRCPPRRRGRSRPTPTVNESFAVATSMTTAGFPGDRTRSTADAESRPAATAAPPGRGDPRRRNGSHQPEGLGDPPHAARPRGGSSPSTSTAGGTRQATTGRCTSAWPRACSRATSPTSSPTTGSSSTTAPPSRPRSTRGAGRCCCRRSYVVGHRLRPSQARRGRRGHREWCRCRGVPRTPRTRRT